MIEDRNYILYKITAPDSDKFYIGVTGRSTRKRFRDHRWNALNGKKKHRFYYWLKKHMETAEITPMVTSLTKGVALELERIAVDLCFKYESTFILNTAPGGGIPSAKGRRWSDEQKAAIGARYRGKKHSQEFCARISERQRGKKHSAAHRAKISQSLKLRDPSISAAAVEAMNMATRKPVVGTGANGKEAEFASICDAARSIGVSDSAIRQSIRRGTKCCKMTWRRK